MKKFYLTIACVVIAISLAQTVLKFQTHGLYINEMKITKYVTRYGGHERSMGFQSELVKISGTLDHPEFSKDTKLPE